jgi:hypothetical protein
MFVSGSDVETLCTSFLYYVHRANYAGLFYNYFY